MAKLFKKFIELRIGILIFGCCKFCKDPRKITWLAIIVVSWMLLIKSLIFDYLLINNLKSENSLLRQKQKEDITTGLTKQDAILSLASSHELLEMTEIDSRTELWKIINALGIDNEGQGAEIGTWTGDTAYSILDKWGGTLYMIDPYRHLSDWNMPFNKEQYEMDNIFSDTQKRMEPYGNSAVFVRKQAKSAHHDFDDLCFDWIFIDGDHTLKGIFADLWNYWKKLKPRGLLCGHDYRNTPGIDGFDSVDVKNIVDALSLIHI